MLTLDRLHKLCRPGRRRHGVNSKWTAEGVNYKLTSTSLEARFGRPAWARRVRRSATELRPHRHQAGLERCAGRQARDQEERPWRPVDELLVARLATPPGVLRPAPLDGVPT